MIIVNLPTQLLLRLYHKPRKKRSTIALSKDLKEKLFAGDAVKRAVGVRPPVPLATDFVRLFQEKSYQGTGALIGDSIVAND